MKNLKTHFRFPLNLALFHVSLSILLFLGACQVKEKKCRECPSNNSINYEVNPHANDDQTTMNINSYEDYLKAKKQMVDVIQEIKRIYNRDSLYMDDTDFANFSKQLDKSQRIWEIYRKTQMELRFPARDEGGSSAPMCENAYQTVLVKQRIADLSYWLRGVEKGDICSGTILPEDQLSELK